MMVSYRSIKWPRTCRIAGAIIRGFQRGVTSGAGWWGRSLAGIILYLALCGTALAAEPKLKLAPNPPWCQEGYRCLTIADYGAMTKIKITLEEKLRRADSGHFGFGCAVGPSLGIAVDEDLNAHFVPTVAVTCGAVVKF